MINQQHPSAPLYNCIQALIGMLYAHMHDIQNMRGALSDFNHDIGLMIQNQTQSQPKKVTQKKKPKTVKKAAKPVDKKIKSLKKKIDKCMDKLVKEDKPRDKKLKACDKVMKKKK